MCSHSMALGGLTVELELGTGITRITKQYTVTMSPASVNRPISSYANPIIRVETVECVLHQQHARLTPFHHVDPDSDLLCKTHQPSVL